MDAERKVAAAIFLTAVGKHRRWKGEQIYHPKKTFFFVFRNSLSRKVMQTTTKMELEKRSSIEEEVI